MHARTQLGLWLVLLTIAACQEPTKPAPVGAEELGVPMAATDVSLGNPKAVVVNPNANGNGVASTIQEALDRTVSGGQVLVKPGRYVEALVLRKGVTLRPIGGGAGSVVIAPSGAPDIAIQVATSEPVVLQDLTLLFSGMHGIRGDGAVDVTVERVNARAVGSAVLSVQQRVVSFFNDSTASHAAAHVTLRENTLNGGVGGTSSGPPSSPFPQMFGITLQGDITATVERNTLRQMGGACIAIVTRADLGGETHAEIVGNDLDECYPLQGAGSLIVQGAAGRTGTVTATGIVDIVGNTIRNSFGSALPATAITQMYAPGRIERNRILGVVQPGAKGIATRNPAAIWVGTLSTTTPAPSIAPVVRFNDIEGNAYAGLRVGPNIKSSLDATCNWWGSPDGPQVLTVTGSTVRDALVTEPAAMTPSYRPFAKAPIAFSGATSCD
jgi:hypothetical protein